MRALSLIAVFILILAMPSSSYALGLEMALGGWHQTTSGTMSHGADPSDDVRVAARFMGPFVEAGVQF